MTEYSYENQRRRAAQLLESVPDEKLLYVIGLLEGAAIPDLTPNTATLEAMSETDRMIADGAGQHFTGSTEDFFKSLLEE